MKYFFLYITFFFIQANVFAMQEEIINNEIFVFQNTLNQEFLNKETSILLPEDFEFFDGLEFYPINLKFRVTASFVRTPGEKPFLMPTTTDRLPEYVKYAELHFNIDSQNFVLEVFQNTNPKEGYENYLFLPFTDLTSGNGSYGGGRYMDIFEPDGDEIILDFNQSYNPYCVYNSKYSCPIPPEQNDIKIRIEAGIKDFKKQE
ncbi:MAG: DUF1684 domain-containing protein [Flavobacteriaceae bacterium]|nr:DUF1684 domain-containing protein [Flavobacteriaceae bacterium]